jgi:hypothetical protein
MKPDHIESVKGEKSAEVCYQCYSPDLRRSRLRRSDIREILRGRFPARCIHCRERQFVPLYLLLKLEPPNQR